MRHSHSTKRNPAISDWTVKCGKRTNLQFFSEAFMRLDKQSIGNRGLMTVGFIGSRDLPGHTLRTAQAMLRWDLRPSYWSHVFVVTEPVTSRTSLSSLPILEVPLHPRNGLFPKPECNGINQGTLGLYENRDIDANVGLVAVSMSDEEAQALKRRARNWNQDRVRYNFWDMLGAWQSFLWSQGAKRNPLREGMPIPASSYLEFIFEGLGLGVTPGASERNSAPEHLWNAACWWHKAFKEQERKVAGMFVARDPGCAMLRCDE
ncbi:MAG: hypothetical protein KC563_03105 [Nitrospira sp.]|nr:hypothetical protein [Nitrospira sp.]MCB9710486.1 hypothetical protein [Nitrospiraceae bacterium]MDR4487412.1 hypothetical protein [Nitrospirales bacterium]MCA9464542.1 hypothetical protein [Nitrospira sp.]MCA9474785.1 hypothetical protein [Nitrospira sp.]